MRVWSRVLGVAIACLGLVAVLPAAAGAATPPSSGPLTNSAGAANGCTASARVHGASAGKYKYVVTDAILTCPQSADVHLQQFYNALYEIRQDGSLRSVYPPSPAESESYAGPIYGDSTLKSQDPCDDPGTHVWIALVSVKTATVRGAAPFTIKLRARGSVTCT